MCEVQVRQYGRPSKQKTVQEGICDVIVAYR